LAFGGCNTASQKEEFAGVGQWEEIGSWLAQKIETWHLRGGGGG